MNIASKATPVGDLCLRFWGVPVGEYRIGFLVGDVNIG